MEVKLRKERQEDIRAKKKWWGWREGERNEDKEKEGW